jgi:hypothetical protein
MERFVARKIGFSVVLAFLASAAWADVDLQRFAWRPDSRFTLTMYVNGNEIVFKGNLRDEQTAEVKQDAYTAVIKSYDKGESFLSILVTSDYDDMANLFILEGPKEFKRLGTAPLLGRKATLRSSLEAALTALQQMNSWDPSISLRKLVDFVESHPNKKVEDFADEVELKNPEILTVPKPKPAGRRAEEPVQDNPAPVQLEPVERNGGAYLGPVNDTLPPLGPAEPYYAPDFDDDFGGGSVDPYPPFFQNNW